MIIFEFSKLISPYVIIAHIMRLRISLVLTFLVIVLATITPATQEITALYDQILRPYPAEKVTLSAELSKLWDVPLDPVGYEVIKADKSGSINIEEIYYPGRDYKGKSVKIFGYFCYPNSKKPLPAILLSHGGGGTAKLSTSINWAKRGYAVLAIDLPGKGFQRENSRSTGPDMDVPILLRTLPDPSYNYLVHAVAALRNGITFLSCREEVDNQRIGLVGLSWGGVLTLLTNGQDKRLKAAVNVFGAGYIPEGCTWQDRFAAKSQAELADWYRYIDPKNFLKTQHAPILCLTGTNDHCYYLPTFQKSFAEITAPKKLVLIPNLRHQFLPSEQKIVLAWLDNYLKNDLSLPEIILEPLTRNKEGKLIIAIRTVASAEITKAFLSYAIGAPSRWTTNKWTSIPGYYEENVWYFGLPTTLVQPDLLFFVTVYDAKGAAVSTPVRSLLKVKISAGYSYAMTAPIQKSNIHEPPWQILGLARTPGIGDFIYSKQERTYKLGRTMQN